MIERVRIDERLIHGQVASYWTRYLNISRIMVVDDNASGNQIQKTALKMACPAGVKLSVLTVDKAVARMTDPNEHRYDNDRILMIFKGTDTLREAIEKGMPIKEVNVGNISKKIGSVTINKSTAVTPQDIENVKAITDKGIKMYVQMVPSDTPFDALEAINKASK